MKCNDLKLVLMVLACLCFFPVRGISQGKEEGEASAPTKEEAKKKGLVKYNDKWMTYEEMMTAKGYIKVKGKWLKKADAMRPGAARARLPANPYKPKGIIDKPGADKEKLSWDQHRTKESNHYIVKSNLTEEALNDIVCVLESLYSNHKLAFRLTQDPPNKLTVWVFKNQKEYVSLGKGDPKSTGAFIKAKDKTKVITFYQPPDTTAVLLREGTRWFVDLTFKSRPPCWLDIGLATYYESSKFDDKGQFTVNLINQNRLPLIKETINENCHKSLKTFINITQDQCDPQCYAQAWSLYYFLVNCKNHKYVRKLRNYYDALKTEKRSIKANKHIKIFERNFGPLKLLEKEWKDYITRR